MAASMSCLLLGLAIAITCCCSPADARSPSASQFRAAKQRFEVILADQKNTLLRSVRAKHSRPAPRRSKASNQRVASIAAARLQDGPFCGDGTCDAGENCNTCAQDCFQANPDANGNPVRCKRVGIMYSVWHWPAVNARKIQADNGQTPVTVEDVLRSRQETPFGVAEGAHTLGDVINNPGVRAQSMEFHPQYTPQRGFYCLYRQRAPGALNYNPDNEGKYQTFANQPDCINITETLTQHAQMLTDAHIDFVAVDATNLFTYDATTDAIQLRPFEVLCEVWADLRSQGIPTPEIAIWQRMPKDQPFNDANKAAAVYPYVLNVYNDPRFAQVLMKDSDTRKFIFFMPRADQFDEGFTADVQSNGGQNNIAAVYMWVNRETINGWNFMSFCKDLARISSNACNQSFTSNTTGSGIPIGTTGSQLAVSPGYQTTYHSLTQQGTGKWEGLTFQKQFQTAFTVKPSYLFISTWNEQLAQPQSHTNPDGSFNPPPPYSMGLESDDTSLNRAFVDVYGMAFNRDIEPSVEFGTTLYDIMASCLKLFKNGNVGCTRFTTQEPCCKNTSFNARYKYVSTTDGEMGVRNAPAADSAPFYRCTAPAVAGRRRLLDNPWFYTTDPNCEGDANPGYTAALIGYIPTAKGGDFLRALRRCYNRSTGDYTKYILNDRSCGDGYDVNAILGYVR